MNRLENRIGVVTGGGRGIGAAIAAHFAKEGGVVVVTDKNPETARAVAGQIGGEARHLDVSREDHWASFAEDFPQFDVLVNNAGITGFEEKRVAHDPENATLADWRAVHRVNLDGTFLGCRYAIRAMRKKGAGSIINIASRSGLVGIPGAAAYAASKAGIRNHTKTVALYCAQEGLKVRCNAIFFRPPS